MAVKLSVSTTELTEVSNQVHTAWQKARKAQNTINDIEESRKNYSHCCELYGAYFMASRLLGGVSDTEWRGFLKGE